MRLVRFSSRFSISLVGWAYLYARAVGETAFYLQHGSRKLVAHGSFALVVVRLADAIVVSFVAMSCSRGGFCGCLHGPVVCVAPTQAGHECWLCGRGGRGSVTVAAEHDGGLLENFRV